MIGNRQEGSGQELGITPGFGDFGDGMLPRGFPVFDDGRGEGQGDDQRQGYDGDEGDFDVEGVVGGAHGQDPAKGEPNTPTASSAQISRNRNRMAPAMRSRPRRECTLRRTSSMLSPVIVSRIPMMMKSEAVQTTSEVNCMANQGMLSSRAMPAMMNNRREFGFRDGDGCLALVVIVFEIKRCLGWCFLWSETSCLAGVVVSSDGQRFVVGCVQVCRLFYSDVPRRFVG